MNLSRRLAPVIALLLLIVLFGTAGYMLLEDWAFVDALYMTVITLTTVGFGETYPLDPVGRIFTIVLIVLGISILAYASRVIVEYVLTTNVSQVWRQRRMKQQLAELHDHLIVCGFGRVGENACQTLSEGRRPFLVIDDAPAKVSEARAHGWLALEGDATHDEILKEVKLGLQECGRKLGTYIRKGKRLKAEFEKRSYIEKYIPHIGIALQEILDLTDKKRDETVAELEDVLHRSRKF